MRIIDEATLNAAVEIQQAIADYWHDVDANNSAAAPEFFTEDCVFDVGDQMHYEGRAGIRAFYDHRALRGRRTTRHTFCNVRVELDSPTSAKVDYVIVNYAADGAAPVVDFEGASLVSQMNGRYVRQPNGAWLVATLRGEPVFIGKEPYTREVLVKI
jgi:ketosteroid isomerase-like protein